MSTFLSAFFRTVVRETLPDRVSADFGSLGGGPDVDSAAHGQCFVKVEPFSPERAREPKRDRKRSESDPQITPKVVSEDCSGTPRAQERDDKARSAPSSAPDERKSSESCARRGPDERVWTAQPPTLRRLLSEYS